MSNGFLPDSFGMKFPAAEFLTRAERTKQLLFEQKTHSWIFFH